MGNTENINLSDARFQGLLERFLRVRSAGEKASDADRHLDEDSFAAFVEGNMTMREATPVIKHLADCGFCRHKTAELVKLDFAFAETEIPASIPQTAPAKAAEALMRRSTPQVCAICLMPRARPTKRPANPIPSCSTS